MKNMEKRSQHGAQSAPKTVQNQSKNVSRKRRRKNIEKSSKKDPTMEPKWTILLTKDHDESVSKSICCDMDFRRAPRTPQRTKREGKRCPSFSETDPSFSETGSNDAKRSPNVSQRAPQKGVRDAPGRQNAARVLPKRPQRTALEWYMVCVVVLTDVAVELCRLGPKRCPDALQSAPEVWFVVAAVAVVLCRLVLRRARTALEWYKVCVVEDGLWKSWWRTLLVNTGMASRCYKKTDSNTPPCQQ